MRVRVTAVNQDTGAETLMCSADLEAVCPDDSERRIVEGEIVKSGRCWVDGGAAHLYRITPSWKE